MTVEMERLYPSINPRVGIHYDDLCALLDSGEGRIEGVLPPEWRDIYFNSDDKVVVVFGGGGALSPYGIGVAYALRKANIPIDAVIGCSAGSISAKVVAHCYNDQAWQYAMECGRTVKWRYLRAWQNLFARGAIMSFERLEDYMNGHGEVFRERFGSGLRPLPTVIVATNINDGRPFLIWGSNEDMNDGRAIRASCSNPRLCEPVCLGDLQLIDGSLAPGFLLPLAVAKHLAPDSIIIAVQLVEERRPERRPRNQPHFTLTYNPRHLFAQQWFSPRHVAKGYEDGRKAAVGILPILEKEGIKLRPLPNFY